MNRKNSKRLGSGVTAGAHQTTVPVKALPGRKGAPATQADMNLDWFKPYEGLTFRIFRMAGISDPDLIDSVRNQVAINLAVSLDEGRYDPNRSPLGGYLWGMVLNTCRSEIRRDQRFPELRDFSALIPEADDRTDPAMQVANREFRQIILSALYELPPRYRVALMIAFGIPDSDGVIPTRVEPRNSQVLFRAARRLRDVLRARYPDISVLF